MSEKKTEPSSKLGLTPEEAAAASIAQTLAFAAQNEVDAIRNQNTVNMVTMGVAYAKWLQNPVMGSHFSELVNATRLNDGLIGQGQATVSRHMVNQQNVAAFQSATPQRSAPSHTLPSQIFNYFLSPPNTSE